jgi:hypothetical protein
VSCAWVLDSSRDKLQLRADGAADAADPVDPASLLAVAFNLNSGNKDFTLDIPNTREVRLIQVLVDAAGNQAG